MLGTKGGISLEKIEQMLWPDEILEWWQISMTLLGADDIDEGE